MCWCCVHVFSVLEYSCSSCGGHSWVTQRKSEWEEFSQTEKWQTHSHIKTHRKGERWEFSSPPPSSLLPVQPVCTSQSLAGPSLSPSLSLGGAPSLCSAWLYCLDVYLHRVYGAFPRVCPAPCLLPMHCGFLSFTAGSFPSPLPKHPTSLPSHRN